MLSWWKILYSLEPYQRDDLAIDINVAVIPPPANEMTGEDDLDKNEIEVGQITELASTCGIHSIQQEKAKFNINRQSPGVISLRSLKKYCCKCCSKTEKNHNQIVHAK